MLSTAVLEQRVVIAVDPHKASWTAAAVSSALAPLATITVQVGPQGYRQLRCFAERWSTVVWAIEGAGGPGGPLVTRLVSDGIEAVDVPAKLAARVRMLSTGHGRKNDNADAISVGVAALTVSGLRSAAVDEAIMALRALIEHRDDIVRNRTQMINRLHVLLTQLVPGGAPGRLTVDTAATLLRGLRPRATSARTLRRLAVDLVAEIRHLDRRIAARDTDIAAAVAEAGCTLAELRGIGTLLAAKILSRVGDVHRFRSAAAFATFNGTAPLEVSSGGTVRHRLSRAGDRQLNCCLHIMAITQLRRDCDGRRYTCANARRARVTRKPCVVRSGGCRTWSTASSSPTLGAGTRRAREDTRGRLQNPARPAQPLPPALRTSHFPGPSPMSLSLLEDQLDQRGADELRERAVRLYLGSEPRPVIRRLAEQLGVHHEALRTGIRQAQADRGDRAEIPTTAEAKELRRLRRENTELRRANEILKAASAFSPRRWTRQGGSIEVISARI